MGNVGRGREHGEQFPRVRSVLLRSRSVHPYSCVPFYRVSPSPACSLPPVSSQPRSAQLAWLPYRSHLLRTSLRSARRLLLGALACPNAAVLSAQCLEGSSSSVCASQARR